LHGDPGDGQPLSAADEQAYRKVMERNAEELVPLIGRDDVVILHDPQTAGLAPLLKPTGAKLVWRCHVGTEAANEYVTRAWNFLRPFVASIDEFIFSRDAHVPQELRGGHTAIIPPSIDPFSPKNEDLP